MLMFADDIKETKEREWKRSSYRLDHPPYIQFQPRNKLNHFATFSPSVFNQTQIMYVGRRQVTHPNDETRLFPSLSVRCLRIQLQILYFQQYAEQEKSEQQSDSKISRIRIRSVSIVPFFVCNSAPLFS